MIGVITDTAPIGVISERPKHHHVITDTVLIGVNRDHNRCIARSREASIAIVPIAIAISPSFVRI